MSRSTPRIASPVSKAKGAFSSEAKQPTQQKRGEEKRVWPKMGDTTKEHGFLPFYGETTIMWFSTMRFGALGVPFVEPNTYGQCPISTPAGS